MVVRHRLNRSGDRQLNHALRTVVLVRMRQDEATKAYVERRLAEGKSVREVKRCLKRYLFRQLQTLPVGLVRDIEACRSTLELRPRNQRVCERGGRHLREVTGFLSGPSSRFYPSDLRANAPRCGSRCWPPLLGAHGGDH